MNNHAATIGLKLGIPVIVGVKDATKIIREGVIISLDAQRGLIYSGIGNGAATLKS
jgi:pyruvate kinase